MLRWFLPSLPPTSCQPAQNQENTATTASKLTDMALSYHASMFYIQTSTTLPPAISDDLQYARQYRQTQEYPSPSDLLARKSKTRQIVPVRWERSITQYPAAGGRNAHPWENPPALLPRQYINGEIQGSNLYVRRILYADGFNHLRTFLCTDQRNVNVSLSLCQSSAATEP